MATSNNFIFTTRKTMKPNNELVNEESAGLFERFKGILEVPLNKKNIKFAFDYVFQWYH